MKYKLHFNVDVCEVCVFLEISEGIDKVWHRGLLFKLQAYGAECKLLALLKDYEQRVVLNGQTSDSRKK